MKRADRALAIAVCIAVLFIPWPDGDGPPFVRSVATTILELNRTTVRMLGRFAAFQADIATPQSGEFVLPNRVQDMLAMLRAHGVKRYQLSPAIAADAWDLQQIVVSSWPRKLEPDANARFLLNHEPLTPGCVLVDRRREVSLVYCP
jgi:hypothetical protein